MCRDWRTRRVWAIQTMLLLEDEGLGAETQVANMLMILGMGGVTPVWGIMDMRTGRGRTGGSVTGFRGTHGREVTEMLGWERGGGKEQGCCKRGQMDGVGRVH